MGNAKFAIASYNKMIAIKRMTICLSIWSKYIVLEEVPLYIEKLCWGYWCAGNTALCTVILFF